MENINFIKNIDNLGRIVIPMDVRRKLNINTGDVLSIMVHENNVVLSKYSSLENNNRLYNILSIFSEILGIKYILVNKQIVVYSDFVPQNSKYDKGLQQMVISGNSIRNTKQDFVFGMNKVSGIYNMLPIITKDGIEGSIIVFGSEVENGYKYCELLSKIIMLELNIT